ncbi:MAG: universal stress protein [bacterium]|nr:universal stress protein [bacterium]
MSTYKRIMTATDLREQSSRVIEYAAALARAVDAELHFAHVVEPLPLVYGGDFAETAANFERELRQEAGDRLREAARAHGVRDEHCHLASGSAAAAIRRLAKELDADLVVIGTHRRRGLEFFIGSTSNAVLHDPGFDVLAVRLEPDA